MRPNSPPPGPASKQAPCVLEKMLPLKAECSVIVARGWDGRIVSFAPQRNVHVDGILAVTQAYEGNMPGRPGAARIGRPPTPSPTTSATSACCASSFSWSTTAAPTARWWSTKWRRARTTAATTPWTPATSRSSTCRCTPWPACRCRSRAGIRRPSCSTCWATCGSTPRVHSRTPDWQAVLALPGTHLHLYGKTEARAGRKMGHLNITGADVASRQGHGAPGGRHPGAARP